MRLITRHSDTLIVQLALYALSVESEWDPFTLINCASVCLRLLISAALKKRTDEADESENR